jgi:predicted N-acyltransferase
MERAGQQMNNLKVEIIDTISNINKNKWNNLVEQSKLGSFFHRYEWLKAIEDEMGLEPRHIVVTKDGYPIGIFPNFIQKIPKAPIRKLFSVEPGYGGPVIIGQEKQVLDLMLEKISKICKGNIIFHQVMTGNIDYIRYERYFEKMGYRPVLRYCRFVVDLNKTYEEIKANMSSGRRRNLSKILNKDFEVKDEIINYENIKDFYEGYKKVIRRLDTDALPFQFFINLKNSLRDRIKIFTAIVEGKQAGKLLYIIDKEQSSFYYCFSAINELNFKYHSAELLHLYAIKWAMENNFKKYDFGYSITDFDDGLFKFKHQFGIPAVPLILWEKGYSMVGWNLFKVTRSIIKKFG